jgi:hypothetical protein
MTVNVSQRQFSRFPSPVDIKDYPLKGYIPRFGDLSGNQLWEFRRESPLDQGDHPWCVGFSGADYGINDPVQDPYDNETGKKFYDLCKIIDGEPGAQNGSCVRSIAKVLQNEGRISNYAFAASTDEITYWLLHKGPVIVGTSWYEGMSTADENNIVHISGVNLGGHAYVLNGVTTVAGIRCYRIQNSWNGYFGIMGQAYISITDFAILLRNQGEAMAAVENPLDVIPVTGKGCAPLLGALQDLLEGLK